ncbi:hypothetical protein QO012_000095 [Methylobacterium aerolatum]|uniref:Uncharacterized protein n=1 Tax=Methylobacterium aerolatum TaxID=418708 RepID=A0ABU0HUN1_9HYPH|nr:hypothetical protein [Methylobacterium aerolatum]GJD36274.1 hypothetical protein FMGBMHLM_3191 [Methylobacterium aerolatum]
MPGQQSHRSQRLLELSDLLAQDHVLLAGRCNRTGHQNGTPSSSASRSGRESASRETGTYGQLSLSAAS